MTSQIFTIHATTALSGDWTSSALAQTSGILNLYSDMWSGIIINQSDNLGLGVFRVPKGCDFKIWENTLYGAPATVSVQSSADGYGSSWNPVKTDNNNTMGGELVIKHSARPVVIRSQDGNKAVRFAYNAYISGNAVTMSGTVQNANVYADYVVEVVESCQY